MKQYLETNIICNSMEFNLPSNIEKLPLYTEENMPINPEDAFFSSEHPLEINSIPLLNYPSNLLPQTQTIPETAVNSIDRGTIGNKEQEIQEFSPAPNSNKEKIKGSKKNNVFKCNKCGKTYLSYPALYTHNKLKHVHAEEVTVGLNGRMRGRPRKIKVSLIINNCSRLLTVQLKKIQ